MEQEDFDIECSDEELKDAKGPWEPSPEVIDRLYSILEKGEIPELSWKCPGYRAPSPEKTVQEEDNTTNSQVEENTDFDFMDEAISPRLKMRKDGEEALKGSAKKKVTSLDGVINNMRRHKLLPTQPQAKDS